MKGVGVVNAPADLVLEFLVVPANIKLFDRMCESGEIIQILDKRTHICQLKFSTTICISKQSRDFVLARHNYAKQDGSLIIVACSVDHPDCPKLKGYIRGEIFCGGYVVQPVPENKNQCIVTYISYFDIGHFPIDLPDWIKDAMVERIYEKQPLNIHYLRRVVENLFKENSNNNNN